MTSNEQITKVAEAFAARYRNPAKGIHTEHLGNGVIRVVRNKSNGRRTEGFIELADRGRLLPNQWVGFEDIWDGCDTATTTEFPDTNISGWNIW
jgi:hypothetical protein